MFNILENANILTKAISFIVAILAIIITKNPVLLLIFLLLLIILNKRENIVYLLIIITLSIINITLNINIIIKLIIVFEYISLISKAISFDDLRLLIEKIFYRNKNNVILKFKIYVLYFIKEFKQNLKKINHLEKETGMEIKVKYNFTLIKQAYVLTKNKLKHLGRIQNLRYYNISGYKTLPKLSFEIWDHIYLIIHVIILIICIGVRYL